MKCGYCEGDRTITSSQYEDVILIIREETIVKHYDDSYGWQHDGLELKYCPMCGTKLEKESPKP